MKANNAVSAGAANRLEATTDLEAVRPEEESRPRGARSLQSALEQSLQAAPGQSEGPDAAPKRPDQKLAIRVGSTPRRLAKVALGLALMVSLGWSPLRAMLTTTSVEALVNARVETIRSPIEGTVESAPDPNRDWIAGAATPRLRVVDSRADHTRLDDLRRQYEALESQSHILSRQSELASAALKTLDAQVERFREGRLKLLDARLEAQTAELGTAAAKASEAADLKRRTEQLRKIGVATSVEGDRAQYAWVAATSAEAAAAQRLEEARVERDAVAQGVFIGDSYNDSPSSDQRATELRLRVGELDAQAAAARSQIGLLANQIAEEEIRSRDRSRSESVV